MNVLLPEIETERLILRKFTQNDLEPLFLILSDKQTNTYLPWFPVQTIEETQSFLQHYQEEYQQTLGHQYAVCFKKDNLPIGYVHLSYNDSYDLGYGLRHDFWRMGITTEACLAIIEQLRKIGFSYITATHDRNNPRSGEVMKKISMTYRYSYEEQWQPKDKLVVFRMYQLNFDGQDSRVYQKYWNQSKQHFIESFL